MRHWTLGAVARRATEVLKEEGIRALFFRMLGETVYRRAIVAEFSLSESIPTIVPRVPIQIELLRASQAEEYHHFRPGVDRSEIERRLEQGHWCLVGWRSNRIVSAWWACPHQANIQYLSRRVEQTPGEAYVYEALTLHEFRHANISSAIGVEIARLLRADGYRRLWAIIVPENKPGLQLVYKAGYRRRGIMGYIRLGKWQYDFVRWDRPTHITAHNAGADYWGDVLRGLEARGHYLDTFLAKMKRGAYLSLIARWGGAPESGYVLKTDLFEEATGADAFLPDLCREQNRVIGIDISHAVVDRARSKSGSSGIPQGSAGPTVSWLAADVRQLPFSTDIFSLVVSPSTLDHFSDPSDLDRSLQESARILAPGGRMIVTLDNRQNISDPLFRLANRWGWLPFNIGRSCTIAELVKALESAGLQVQDTTAILHNPRLIAVGVVHMTQKIGWQRLILLMQRLLVAMQRLGDTRIRYRTGSFIAALAVKPESPNVHFG